MTMTAPPPHAAQHEPMNVDLKLRLVARPGLVAQPGDFAYETPDESALDGPDGARITHLLHVCDHYGVVHVLPCTTQSPREGQWKLTGSTKTPSLRPTVSFTNYRGAIAFGALTPDMAGRA